MKRTLTKNDLLKGYLLFYTLLFSSFWGACSSEKPAEEIGGNSREVLPYRAVYYQLDLHGEKGQQLQAPYTMVIIRTPNLKEERLGHGGLILVNTLGVSTDRSYYAFDGACPNDFPEKNLLLPLSTPPKGVLLAVRCPSCRTTYDLTLGLGNPLSEKRKPLQQYRLFLSSEQLLIKN